ncbi:MAG: transposase [Deltaproteobacteria bacterium]|nr:transposase [Deltaproteobacteria bacterium]
MCGQTHKDNLKKPRLKFKCLKCKNVSNAYIVGSINVLASRKAVKSNALSGDGASRPTYELANT